MLGNGAAHSLWIVCALVGLDSMDLLVGVVLQADLEAELGVEVDARGLDHPWLHQKVASLRL